MSRFDKALSLIDIVHDVHKPTICHSVTHVTISFKVAFLYITLHHIQVPLDEMDYAVTNLAVDLRDGLRIT